MAVATLILYSFVSRFTSFNSQKLLVAKGTASALDGKLWGYRPSRVPYQMAVARLLVESKPPEEIKIDFQVFRVEIEGAALDRKDWLFHPCFAALTTSADTLAASVQALLWVSKHDPTATWSVNCDRPLAVWTAGGGQIIPPGRHTSSSLISKDPQVIPTCLPVDLWGLSVGRRYADTLSLQDDIRPEQRQLITQNIARLVSALANLEHKMPACAAWLRHASRLIIPLFRDKDGRVRSASREAAMGAIFCDLAPFPNVLEAVIHETAHQHFYLTELSLRLVRDEAAQYYSPLRKELRPLRGVFLAYHALVHIRSFYLAARETELISPEFCESSFQNIQQDLNVARQSMTQGIRHLTDAGRELFYILEAETV